MSPHTCLVALVLLSGFCAGPVWAQGGGPAPITAVFRIENRGSDLSGDEVDALTDYLGTKLGEGGRFHIIPREEIRRRLIEQKKESYKSCYDKKCQVEVGRELAAQFSVSAAVSRVGTRCLITAAMYDLKKAATWRTATAKADCNADALLVAVEEIAAKLTGTAAAREQVAPEEKPAAATPTITVWLNTEPKGAEVLIGGRLQGETPLYLTMDRGRKYRVVIQKEGYKTIDREMAFDTPARLDEKLIMTAERLKSREANRTEWLTWYLGLFTAGGEIGFGESLSLFTIKWDHFYWTIMDTQVAIITDSGEGDDVSTILAYTSRVGFPINVGSRAQHQFRIGLGAGMCLSYLSGDRMGMCFSPSLGYVYQTGGWYHLGVNLSTFISTSSNEDFPVFLAFFAPLGWTGSAD
jgi:hypothetical protein